MFLLFFEPFTEIPSFTMYSKMWMINVSVSDCYVLDLVPVHFESQDIWFGILLVIRFHVLYIYTYIYLPQRFTCSSIQMSRPVQGICFTFACSVCLKEG